MPSWLIPILKLAIQIGNPYILELLHKYLSKLPEIVQEIILDLIKGLKNPDVPNSAARKAAAIRLKECVGVGCAPDTKRD